jgi:hypothetical protein
LVKMTVYRRLLTERVFPMRLIVMIIALLPPTASAQVLAPSPHPPPVNQEGMQNFCIYGNQLYSLGAQLCVPGSNAGMRCTASEGPKSAGRAFWSFDSKEWPPSAGWRCGSGG